MAGVALEDQGKGPTVRVDPPEHVAPGDALQIAYYEGGNPAPLGVWEKLPEGGAVDLHTGRHTGEGFPDDGPFRQM